MSHTSEGQTRAISGTSIAEKSEMETQAEAGPHAFRQLGVTSKKLLGELADVVLLSEAAQDQVADAVHDLVQHLLLGLR